MADYFYIKNGKIIGCGQAQVMNDDVINAEVTPDMVNYSDNYSWESERFKWKYIWDGEKIVDNPNFEQEEYERHYEEVRREREEAYVAKVDKITTHINRLRDEEQTPKIKQEIEELKNERAAKVIEIKERYPYPTPLNTITEE